MSVTPRRQPLPSRPAVDEWGMYDPEQAGLAALFARLDARSRQAVADAVADDASAAAPHPASADPRPQSTSPPDED